MNERVTERVEGPLWREWNSRSNFCEERGDLRKGYIGRVERQNGYNLYGGIESAMKKRAYLKGATGGRLSSRRVDI